MALSNALRLLPVLMYLLTSTPPSASDCAYVCPGSAPGEVSTELRPAITSAGVT